MSADTNDTDSHAGDTWERCEMSLSNDDAPGVWMPKPSIHAFSPPVTAVHLMGLQQSPYDSTKRRCRLEDIHARCATKPLTVKVPRTIAIPSKPLAAAVTVTDNEQISDDVRDDDCSSVGMGTVGKESSSLKRSREETSNSEDGYLSLESDTEMPTAKRKYDEAHSLLSTRNEDTTREVTSIVPVPEGLEWNGSLSYLDGLSEHASIFTSKSSHPPHASSGVSATNENVSAPTFGVSKVVHDSRSPENKALRTTLVPHVLDDDSSASSDNDACETVVVDDGSSIPQRTQEFKISEDTHESPKAPDQNHHLDGPFTFLDCFAKDASLDDFLTAELIASNRTTAASPAQTDDLDMNNILASLVFYETMLVPWEENPYCSERKESSPTEDLDMNETLASLVFHETMVVPWETFPPSPIVQ